MKLCSIDGCARPAKGRGWCYTHWARWRRNGDPLALRGRGPTPCRVEDCERRIVRQKLCGLHWQRFERYGCTEIPAPRSPVSRLLSTLILQPDGCWDWAGYRDWNGYGQVPTSVGAFYGTRLAHRAVYKQLVGPIPVGLHLDHLCRNKACVNPSHLDPVTPAENNRRALLVKDDEQ